jgi:hypothetical protein
MTNQNFSELPPNNAHHLHRVCQQGASLDLPLDDSIKSLLFLDFDQSRFNDMRHESLNITCAHPTCGFIRKEGFLTPKHQPRRNPSTRVWV